MKVKQRSGKLLWKSGFLLCLLITGALRVFAQQTTEAHMITTSDGVELYVKRSGKGLPCLFLHGGPGSTSLYFEKEGGNILEKDVEMIYLDQRGSGRSGNLEEDSYEMNRLIQDLEEVREKLGIEKWAVVAHSFGGFLGVHYAKEKPESIAGLVMLNTILNLDSAIQSQSQAILDLLNLTEETAALPEDLKPMERMFALRNKLQQEGRLYELMFDSPKGQAIDDSVMNLIPLNWHFGQNAWNTSLYYEDHYPMTAKVEVPVLVISGARDFAVGPNHYKGMQFPNMTIKEINGGHALYLEHQQEFYEVLSPFLRELSRKEATP